MNASFIACLLGAVSGPRLSRGRRHSHATRRKKLPAIESNGFGPYTPGMPRNVIIAIVVIVVIIFAGMVLTVKRSVRAGLARDAEATAPAKPR